MSLKKQVCVYPFDSQFTPLLRHKELLSDINIVSLVSPHGWGLSGKNAGIADGGCSLENIVSSDYHEQLKKCDSVLFVEPDNQIDFEALLYPKIHMAIDLKKNIICTLPLEEEAIENIKRHCTRENVLFEYYHNYTKPDYECNMYPRLFQINTPVIFVAGLSERTHKFHIQLSLMTNFIKLGYKVSMVGTRKYCEMLGFHSIPDFMLESGLTGADKVIYFNYFIKRIEADEKPDVIIIGLPGGIEAQNDIITNGFGILSSEIASAVKPDAIALSLQFHDYCIEYFKNLSAFSKFKFGIGIDCFNMTNIKFDWINFESSKRPEYLTLDLNFIDKWVERFKSGGISAYNALNAYEASEMTHYLIKKLSQNSYAIM